MRQQIDGTSGGRGASGESVRTPAVAGMFYPDDPAELRAEVRGHLDRADAPPGGPPPKAIIAPHAGYVYSGPVAASVYKALRGARGSIRRVVLLGPAHRVAFRGLALSTATSFATPLGLIPIDEEATSRILGLPSVGFLDAAHAQEHSLEVHLPFLQEVLGSFSLVPIVVGEATAAEVAAVLDALWGGPETLIVVSSDLSHYHDYATAKGMDEATRGAIEAMRPEAIGYEDACGRRPVSGLLVAAKRRGMRVSTVDLRSSGDTAGSRARDRVVGYGSFAFFASPEGSSSSAAGAS